MKIRNNIISGTAKGMFIMMIIILLSSCGHREALVIKNSSNYDLRLVFEDKQRDSLIYLARLIAYERDKDSDFDSLIMQISDSLIYSNNWKNFIQELSDPGVYKKCLKLVKDSFKLSSLYDVGIEILDTSNKNTYNRNERLSSYYADTMSIIDEMITQKKFVIFLPAGHTFISNCQGRVPNNCTIESAFSSNYLKLNIYCQQYFIGCFSRLTLKEFKEEKRTEFWSRGSRVLELKDHEIEYMIYRNH